MDDQLVDEKIEGFFISCIAQFFEIYFCETRWIPMKPDKPDMRYQILAYEFVALSNAQIFFQ